MHHAYPRECKFPHISGTVNKVSELDWAEWKGMDDVMVTPDERKKLMVKDPAHNAMSVEEQMHALPWSTVEELVASSKPTTRSSAIMRKMRYLLGVAALAFMLFPLASATKAAGITSTQE